MVFSIISRLKGKGSATATATASERSPLPPLPLIATCTTKSESVQQDSESLKQSFKDLGESFKDLGESLEQLGESLEQLGQSWELFGRTLKFAATIYIGTKCVVVTAIMTRELMSWYNYESQNDNAFIMYCSNVTRFLRDICTRQADWGKLPPELWGEIGKRMVSRLDIASFRLVCKEWHSSLPSPTGRFPLSLPPPPSCHPKYHDVPYTVNELTIYYDRRLGWAGLPSMQVDQGGIFLPTTTSFYLNKADYLPASISGLLNRKFHKLSLFAKAYYPSMALNSPFSLLDINEYPKKLLLISSSNADGVNPNYTRMCDLSVVAHLVGNMKGRLALLRLGGSPENWAWDTNFCTQVFVNIATYKGQLCTLDRWGRVFLMDYNSLKLTMLCASSSIPPELQNKSFFEHCGDLYLVDLKSWSPKAYKLSLSSKMWIKVNGDIWRISYVAPFLL